MPDIENTGLREGAVLQNVKTSLDGIAMSGLQPSHALESHGDGNTLWRILKFVGITGSLQPGRW
jgi:hypothetical protein